MVMNRWWGIRCDHHPVNITEGKRRDIQWSRNSVDIWLKEKFLFAPCHCYFYFCCCCCCRCFCWSISGCRGGIVSSGYGLRFIVLVRQFTDPQAHVTEACLRRQILDWVLVPWPAASNVASSSSVGWTSGRLVVSSADKVPARCRCGLWQKFKWLNSKHNNHS